MHVALHPLKSAILGGAERKLWMVMAGAALVLLLVCVNLAGLLIAKGAGRAHEIGVRAALGAGRMDIVRQFLIEALILSAALSAIFAAGVAGHSPGRSVLDDRPGDPFDCDDDLAGRRHRNLRNGCQAPIPSANRALNEDLAKEGGPSWSG